MSAVTYQPAFNSYRDTPSVFLEHPFTYHFANGVLNNAHRCRDKSFYVQEAVTMTSITLGWTAEGLVRLTFYLQTITSLKLVAILSNMAFIAYAILISATPILVLHLLLLPLNLFRLFQIFHPNHQVQKSPLDPAELSLLVPFMQPVWMREGEHLFRQGEKADEIFLVLNGEVKLVKANTSLGKDQLLGVMVHFTQQVRRIDSAICMTAVEVASITRDKLRQAMQHESAISEMLLCSVAERAKQTV